MRVFQHSKRSCEVTHCFWDKIKKVKYLFKLLDICNNVSAIRPRPYLSKASGRCYVTWYTRTAGLPIRWTLGLRWYVCCPGSISNPRPILDFPAQTTRGKELDFVVRPGNGLVTLVFEKRCFPVLFRDKIGPLSSNRFFLVSRKYILRAQF